MNSSTFNSNTQPAIPNKAKKAWKLAAGFLCLLFCLFLFDRGLYYLLFQAENKMYTQNHFEQQLEKFVAGKSFNTLIFGTSRTYEGIFATSLERKTKQKIFKETFQGKGPKYNYYFYQVFKKYAGIPKVVIYGVDYFIYTVESDPKWMSHFTTNEPPKKPGLFSAPLLLLKNKKKIDNFLNNVLIQLKKKDNTTEESEIIKEIIAVQNYMGQENAPKKLDTLPNVEKRNRQFFPRPPGTEGEYFIKLLETLSQDRVTVILVALPDYLGSLKTNCQHDEFIEHLESLCGDYSGLHLLNYNSEDKFPLSKPEYFRDGGLGQTNSHLSQQGALIFSNMLADDIKKYYR